MVRTKLFLNNRTQAVRLPKEVALPDSVAEVRITAVGDARIISPVHADIEDWWQHGTRPSSDFLEGRDQPVPQERVW